MDSDRNINNSLAEKRLILTIPNDDWVDKYRASLPKEIDGGEKVKIFQRMSDASERFSHAVLVGLCTALIRGKDMFWRIVFASRGSRIVPFRPEAPIPNAASTAGIPVQGRPKGLAQRRAS
jgi:hypothetical protein